ncbi:MAG TPA: hypothetical protein VF331_25950 [Polyangiales bacterium]
MTDRFETLSAQDLETVAGGLSFTVDFAKGISLDSKLGSVKIPVPNPADILTTAAKGISDALNNAAKLVDLGQLFNFI